MDIARDRHEAQKLEAQKERFTLEPGELLDQSQGPEEQPYAECGVDNGSCGAVDRRQTYQGHQSEQQAVYDAGEHTDIHPESGRKGECEGVKRREVGDGIEATVAGEPAVPGTLRQ